jgi:hypothetical protein
LPSPSLPGLQHNERPASVMYPSLTPSTGRSQTRGHSPVNRREHPHGSSFGVTPSRGAEAPIVVDDGPATSSRAAVAISAVAHLLPVPAPISVPAPAPASGQQTAVDVVLCRRRRSGCDLAAFGPPSAPAGPRDDSACAEDEFTGPKVLVDAPRRHMLVLWPLVLHYHPPLRLPPCILAFLHAAAPSAAALACAVATLPSPSSAVPVCDWSLTGELSGDRSLQ